MSEKRIKSPWLADWLLKVCCRKDYFEEIHGDLQETFEWRIKQTGKINARWRYFLDAFSAIRFVRGLNRLESAVTGSMLLSFIKSSLRNFRRNRAYSFLNIFGLAIGLSAALFILQYVSDELNYDRFDGSNDMYRISQDFVKNNERLYKTAVTAAPLAPALMRDLSKVESAARLLDYTRFWQGKNILSVPDDPEKTFAEPEAYFADPEILDLFDLNLVAGDFKLEEPNTILLSEQMAEKYFGGAEESIGQMIQFSSVKDKPSLVVTGIFQLPRFNMQVSPAALISYKTLSNEVKRQGLYNMWGINSCLTYVKLKKGSSFSEFQDELDDLLLKYNPIETEEDKASFRIGSLLVSPIQEIHLNSTFSDEVGAVGDVMTIKVLVIVAILIVIIAWVNYINLATAHTLNRLKELGIRKVMGAKNGEIVIQFFVEALLMNVFALTMAIGLVSLGQSYFNYFVDKNLGLESIDLLRFGLTASLFFIVGVILSGLYPLTVYFSAGVTSIMKGSANSTRGSVLRKGLIVFQFLASSLLIISTLTINRQLGYMNSKDKGMDIDRVLVVDGPAIKGANGVDNRQKTELIVNRLKQLSNVSYAGTSNSIPGKSILQSQTISRENYDDAQVGQYELVVGSEYLEILNLRIVAGEAFNLEESGNETTEIVLSVSAAKKLGFDSPVNAIGMPVYRWFRGVPPNMATVIGVVEDYHHEALSKAIDPMVFYTGDTWDNHYLIKLNSVELASTISEIEDIYRSSFPDNPMNYYFLDEFFERQHHREEVNSKVFTAFATIALIVACMGLFGLSSFIALQRTKEIGVRKVLGAGVKNVIYLLSKQLLLLATLGFILSVPIGYFGVARWLNGFAYHIIISPWLFVLPFLTVIVLALVAISPRVMKTALMNPVKSLRHE